jgi:hypothetical protein
MRSCNLFFKAAIAFSFLTISKAKGNFITANPSNYTSYLSTLVAGDTLYLTAGTYTNNLTINNRNGTAVQPIVIMGDAALYTTVFHANSCCNTVSITKCSYVVIKNLKLDGLNLAVDAVKGEGTVGNWAHHITLEYLYIVNYGSSQQNVGISTKCSAWNWIIRKNIITGAGTGLYLGNSNGAAPFVNGLIENNLVMNTVGYNMEIKHQLDTVRDDFTGTNVDGKTTIRYNVFSKESNASTGSNARPNVLLGAFPSTGFGSIDYYEVYGNFFYKNPVEALIQVTGNTMLYENIFVNHVDPPGYRAVYITSQNGFLPRDIKVFHNTVWTVNSSGGIRLYNPNTGYQQYCYANAVFSPSPVTGFTNSVNNVTDTYANAGNYVLSATALNTLNLYPQSGQLTGAVTASALFQSYSNWNIDFNGDVFDWTYRGAYSGCCINNGWQLQLDTMPTPSGTSTSVSEYDKINRDMIIFPNPAHDNFSITFSSEMEIRKRNVQIFDFTGRVVYQQIITNQKSVINVVFSSGVYFVKVNDGEKHFVQKLIIE